MSNKNTSTKEAVDLLVHNADDVKVLAAEQRQIADMQHATAHQLYELSAKLKSQADVLQTEVKEAS
jgi:hypothetical protein